jgi:hypothetical protein
MELKFDMKFEISNSIQIPIQNPRFSLLFVFTLASWRLGGSILFNSLQFSFPLDICLKIGTMSPRVGGSFATGCLS